MPQTPNSSRDFGKDIIPYIVQERARLSPIRFTDSCIRAAVEVEHYWRDVGTLDAYCEANIDLTDVVPELNMYDREWPIWTYQVGAAPAKFVHDRDGAPRHGDCLAGLGRTASSPARLPSARCCSPGCGWTRSRASMQGGDPALLQHRARRAAEAGDPRFRRARPEGLVVGEDPILDAEALPPHRGRGVPDQQSDDRAAEVRGFRMRAAHPDPFPQAGGERVALSSSVPLPLAGEG
jgi:glucose-1-phosphate adenylyltransferase